MEEPAVIYYDKIPGLVEIKLDSFLDDRGENIELFNERIFQNFIPDIRVSTVSLSRSREGVCRGFHGDTKSWKIVKPNVGWIQFVALDMRPGNEGSWIEWNLGAEQNKWIALPPGVLNAHQALTNCEFLYLLSHGYVEPKDQLHVKWNKYNIPWRLKSPILSSRDK